MFFAEAGLDRRFALCREFTQELINTTATIPASSCGASPTNPTPGPPSASPFPELHQLAKVLDDTRPITLVSYIGLAEESFEYPRRRLYQPLLRLVHRDGPLEAGLHRLAEDWTPFTPASPKPMIIAEFGADAVPGLHALPPEMFSEEYQAEFVSRYIALLDTKPYVVGQHVWNMCDFKTAQAVHRVGGINYKGVFTRDRQPKLAAHKLHDLWRGKA